MEQRWNDTDRRKRKCWVKNLTPLCFYYSRIAVPSTTRPVGSSRQATRKHCPRGQTPQNHGSLPPITRIPLTWITIIWSLTDTTGWIKWTMKWQHTWRYSSTLVSLLLRRIRRYPMNRRLSGPHSGFERFKEKQIMPPWQESNFSSSAVRPAVRSDSRVVTGFEHHRSRCTYAAKQALGALVLHRSSRLPLRLGS